MNNSIISYIQNEMFKNISIKSKRSDILLNFFLISFGLFYFSLIIIKGFDPYVNLFDIVFASSLLIGTASFYFYFHVFLGIKEQDLTIEDDFLKFFLKDDKMTLDELHIFFEHVKSENITEKEFNAIFNQVNEKLNLSFGDRIVMLRTLEKLLYLKDIDKENETLRKISTFYY